MLGLNQTQGTKWSACNRIIYVGTCDILHSRRFHKDQGFQWGNMIIAEVARLMN